MSDPIDLIASENESITMIPIKGVKSDLVTQTDYIIYVPLASRNTFGTVKIGDGLDINNGLVSISSTILEALASGALHSKALLPYDNTFSYKENSVVLNNGDLYVSLIDDNVGNALTDTESWSKVKLNDVLMLESEMNTLTTLVNGFNSRINNAQNAATEANTKVNRISVTVNDDNSFTFTNGNGSETNVPLDSGVNVDNDTIQRNTDNEIEAIGMKDELGTITPSDVRSKQDALSSTQLDAVDSGIDATKVAQIATNTTNIAAKQDASGNTSLTTTDKSIVGAINEVNSKAAGMTNTVTYDTISDMITALNAMSATELKKGNNIYIVTKGVPDLWVGKVESTSSTYTYTTDAAFVSALTGSLSTTVQVGYYRLCDLETEKVDLSNVVDSNSTISGSGAGNVVTDMSIDSNGNVTLTKGITALTQHQDISGKADKSNTVTDVAYDGTNKKIKKTINGVTTDIVSLETLKEDMDISTYSNLPEAEGGTDVSLVTTGNKYNWNRKVNQATIADAFSTSNTYAVGDIVIYDNTLYICNTAITTAGAWDSSKWTATSVDALLAGKQPAGNYFTLDGTKQALSAFKKITYNNKALTLSNGSSGGDSSGFEFYIGSTYGTMLTLVNGAYTGRAQMVISSDQNNAYFTVASKRYNLPKGGNGTVIIASQEDLFPRFSTSSTYAVGDVVWYASDNHTHKLYICHTAVSSTGSWTGTTNWTETSLIELLSSKANSNNVITLEKGTQTITGNGNKRINIGGYQFNIGNANNDEYYFSFLPSQAMFEMHYGSMKYLRFTNDRIYHSYNDLYMFYPPTAKSSYFVLSEDIAPVFSSSSTYSVGSIVYYQGKFYKCTTAVTTAGSWNASNWTAVTIGELINNISSEVNGKLNKSVKDFDDTGFELTWSNSSNEPCAGVTLDRNSGAGTGCMYADDGNDIHAFHVDENGITYNDNQNTSSDTPIFRVSPAGVLKTNSLTDGTTTKTMTEILNAVAGDYVNKISTASKLYGTDGNGDQTSYNVNDFAQKAASLVDKGYLSDFDTVPTTSGMYYYDGNTAHRPDVLYNDKGIVYYIILDGADRFFQFAFSSYYSGKPFSGAMRHYRNNTFEDWSKIRFAGNCNATLQLKITSDVSLTTTDDTVITNLAKDAYVNTHSFLTLENDNKTITIGKDVTTIKITTLYQLYQNSAATRFVSSILKNGNSGGTPKGYISSASDYQFSRQQIIQEKVFSGLVEGDKFTFAVKSENTDPSNPDVLRKDETRIIIEVLR